MSTKDYFSGHSSIYAAFRPTYPAELYDHILRFVRSRESAWDCGTGNGQVAKELAQKFTNVCASDISDSQLAHAVQAPNIKYVQSTAEETPFADHQFDLVTVGQALHWFDLPKFYAEVKRTVKPGGTIAVWGYALLTISPEIDELFLDFYHNVVGAYWDEARRMVEQEYAGISFPFEALPSGKFEIKVEWTLEQFAGYLESWSATQKFIKANGHNPVDTFIPKVKEVWKNNETKTVCFPVFLKLGRV